MLPVYSATVQIGSERFSVHDFSLPIEHESDDEAEGALRLDRVVLAAISALALVAVGAGCVALYLNLSHTSIGLYKPQMISLPGASIILGGSAGMFVLSLALHYFLVRRNTQQNAALQKKLNPTLAEDALFDGLYLGEDYVITYENRLRKATYYMAISPCTPDIYIFRSEKARLSAIVLLQKNLPVQ